MVDAVADRLVAVVGADQQQDLLALAAQPLDRAMDLGHAAIGLAQHVGMRGRAQRHLVHACGRDRRSRGKPLPAWRRTSTSAQKRWVIAQSPAESWVTVQGADALAAGRERARAMMDVAEMLGIEEVGGPRRDVREGDEAARAWRRARRSRAPAACRRWRGACGCGSRARRRRARRSCHPRMRPMRLPCRPWRAGRQPVAIEAADTRVTDGNTACARRTTGFCRAAQSRTRRRLGPHPVAAETHRNTQNHRPPRFPPRRCTVALRLHLRRRRW